jgi:D-glycero-D-manno-heptose 1,7-bisphosphate phosphatase
MHASRAVFLDRDGVLNRAIVRDGKPYPPQTLNELAILPGVHDACQALSDNKFLLIVVSNQPDIARGSQDRSIVDAINNTLMAELPLTEILICPHDDAEGCECRKPRPGLLLEAARRHQVDMGNSFMVGDRWRDIEAGRHAGCRTAWINYGYNERSPDNTDCVCDSLKTAAAWILSQTELQI